MGNTEEVVEEYEYDSLHKREKVLQKGYQRIKSDFRAEIDKVLLLDKNNCEKESFKIGDFLKIRVHLNASEILEEPAVQIAIFNEKGQCLLSQISKTDNFVIPPILGRLYVDFSIEEIPFNAGAYSLSAKLINGNLINTIDYHINSRRFKMESDGKIGYDGILYLNGNWAVSNE